MQARGGRPKPAGWADPMTVCSPHSCAVSGPCALASAFPRLPKRGAHLAAASFPVLRIPVATRWVLPGEHGRMLMRDYTGTISRVLAYCVATTVDLPDTPLPYDFFHGPSLSVDI